MIDREDVEKCTYKKSDLDGLEGVIKYSEDNSTYALVFYCNDDRMFVLDIGDKS